MVLFVVFVTSCQNLEEININYNGVDPAKTDPNLLISTVITSSGLTAVGLGLAIWPELCNIPRKMGGAEAITLTTGQARIGAGNYGILRNAEELLNKSKQKDLKFHQGAAMILKAYNFGMIADLWGDALFPKRSSESLEEEFKTGFDSQQAIYTGILALLDTANLIIKKSERIFEY